MGKKNLNICRPDYGRCIANLACSVLKYYGLTPPNATLPEADALLQKSYRNVVLLLLDGMGMNILQKHLQPDGFLRRNLRFEYLSTFPPTTVAATTAVTSGLFPNQSAWLGWVGYFPELDRNIVYFLNKDNDTKEKIDGFHAAFTCLPYEMITDRIRETGAEGHFVASFRPPMPDSYDRFCCEIERLCSLDGRKFIYAYWDDPDHTMHPRGTEDRQITALLADLEKRTERMAESLQDTLLLITADHGMMEAECVEWTDHPDLLECLVRPPSIESRAVNLFVKEELRERFESTFRERFGESFLLMTKEQVLAQQILGTGADHVKLDAMLGDYLAVAVGRYALRMENKGYKGEHAGMTEEEMLIPLIVVEKE